MNSCTCAADGFDDVTSYVIVRYSTDRTRVLHESMYSVLYASLSFLDGPRNRMLINGEK